MAPRRGGAKKVVAPPAPAPVEVNGATAAGGKRVKALYTYAANADGEVDMHEGETLSVLAPDNGDGWTEVEREDGSRGVVPSAWVKDL